MQPIILNPEFKLIYMLLIHYLADFALQTVYQAQNKGEGKSFFNLALFNHVAVYSIIWFIAIFCLSQLTLWSLFLCFVFALITFCCHYPTDWITSRLGKIFWSVSDYHNGFNMVGFDQILHYLQLWYSFKLIEWLYLNNYLYLNDLIL